MKYRLGNATIRRLLAFQLLIIPALAACAASPSNPLDSIEPPVYFSIAAIVDTTTDEVSEDEVNAILAIAEVSLYELTGFGMQLTSYTRDGRGGTVEEIAQRYIHPQNGDLPNGLLIFSVGDEDRAKLNRGYAQLVQGPEGFRNEFAASDGRSDWIYVAVLYFGYRYAACGYGGEDTIQSAFAIGDECGGLENACSEWQGMQVCSQALPFLTTPPEMNAGVLVHEYMHPFDWEAGPDVHYATEACNEMMGLPADHFDYEESEFYNGMCPYVYELFIDSYQPQPD